MPQLDTSSRLTVGRDWVKSLALVAICISVSVAFAYVIQTDATGYYERRAKTGGFLILPLLVPFTLWVIYRLFVPFGALLQFGPDGFADRRVNSAQIPWPEIRNIVARSDFVTLTLSRRFVKSYPMSIGQRILKRQRKAGPGHLVVANWCLKSTETDLKDILTAYRAAYSNTLTTAAN